MSPPFRLTKAAVQVGSGKEEFDLRAALSDLVDRFLVLFFRHRYKQKRRTADTIFGDS
jgi:hypothetical protein